MHLEYISPKRCTNSGLKQEHLILVGFTYLQNLTVLVWLHFVERHAGMHHIKGFISKGNGLCKAFHKGGLGHVDLGTGDRLG
jgi:hypothetical protein